MSGVRHSFLGRAGHLGLGNLAVTFGLGSEDPYVVPVPGPVVLLPGKYGPEPLVSGDNYTPVYARIGGLPTEAEPVSAELRVGPSPEGPDNHAPIYIRQRKPPRG